MAGPDRLVAFGAAHGMTVVGHTLVWHSQAPRWLFVDEQNAPVSKARLLKRIETHIQTLVGRYKGRVAIWDVVNEAIDEDEKGWRQSPFLTITGPEFIERAFRLAHEADPKATLLYNDYNEHNPGRRRFLVDVIRDYKRRGVPIHGVGFQGHVGLDIPISPSTRRACRRSRRRACRSTSPSSTSTSCRARRATPAPRSRPTSS